MTLIEVLVSIAILALIGTLIYGAFDGMNRARRGIFRVNERYHQGRQALSRIARELQSAYLSKHVPLDKNQAVWMTAFAGDSERVDFNAFAHRRLGANVHESDQAEIGYFLARDPEQSGKVDLVRREAKRLDVEPTKGGVVHVLAEDVESFHLEYLEPITGEWVDSWDSTQPAGQLGRLPLTVRVTLVMKGGPGDRPIKFETKVPIAMQIPLSFAALQR
ncbi:MAG: general secretion pathway protein GspJ [Polyangiaceae bacterium]|nr:general secretion pathway protein GspJ [Polyangiaceae bacterium]